MMQIVPNQRLFPPRPRFEIRRKKEDWKLEAATEMARMRKACDRVLEAMH